MPIKTSLVEDDPDLQKSMVEILKSYPDIDLVSVFSSAEDCIENIANNIPEVVLMDINLPGLSGIECVTLLKIKYPAIHFMMCTVYEHDDAIFDSLCAGATGYILKTTPPDEILKSILDIKAGGSPITPSIARKVIKAFNTMRAPADELALLSPREKEILEYLSKGYRYKEIGSLLNISTETVRTHIRNIYEKLQVQSRTEALNKIYKR
ncbi:MAG: response regulator transcription factor [Bacteroidota bacterium]|nr:response regulator transcription factor [Bacteroidota bacterium]